MRDWKTGWLLVGLMAVAAGASAQVDSSRVVVVINGEEVRGGEYYHRMEFLPNVSRQMGSSLATFPPGFLTIEQLITERLVLQMAKDKGVYPTDPEVQAEIRARLEENPKMVDDFLATGQSRQDLEYQMRIELAQFKLRSFGITITDQEIDQFYKANPVMFTIPKRVNLKVIVVQNAEAKGKVDAELAGTKDFSAVAKEHSVDLTKDNGGEFGTVPITELNPELRKAVEATKIGQTTDWVGSGELFAKFLLAGVTPPETLPLDAKLRRKLRRELMLQRGSVKNDLVKEMAQYRAKAKIDIRQKEFADAWEKFINSYLKEKGVGSGG